jgi:membrane fusion protein, multidrug efflux system
MKGSMTKAKTISAIPFFLFSLFFVLQGCKQEEAPPETLQAVKYDVLSRKGNIRSRILSGVVKSADESDLSFRVGGLLQEITVTEGQFVEKGTVLAILDPQDYKLNVDEKRAEVSSAAATLTERKENIRRKKILLKDGFSTQAIVQEAEAAYQNALQSLDIAETRLEDAETQLERTELKAPFSGTVAKRLSVIFKEVEPGQKIFRFQSQNGLEVQVMVPETLIGEVDKKERISATFPTLKGVKVFGEVSEIGAVAEDGNAYKVILTLHNTENLDIRSGMTANIQFTLDDNVEKQVFVIPMSAIDLRYFDKKLGELNEQATVYVFDKNTSTLKIKRIETREIIGNKVEVVSGLEDGDILITAGVSFLNEGQKVTLWKPQYSLPATLDK